MTCRTVWAQGHRGRLSVVAQNPGDAWESSGPIGKSDPGRKPDRPACARRVIITNEVLYQLSYAGLPAAF
jgi:hypothetical protein